MARTITWTGATSNDATVASNWAGDSLPASGDTAILPGTAASSGTIDFVGQGGTALAVNNLTIEAAATADAIDFTDAAIVGGSITSADGATPGAFTLSLTDSTTDTVSWFLGDFSTLDLTGSTPTSTVIAASGSGNNASVIKQTGADKHLAINVTGTVSNDGQMWLQSTGGQAALNIAQDGTNAGFYGLTSALLVLGEALTVSGDANTGTRFSNNGFVLIDGQAALATATLSARMNSISGEIDILGGAGGALLDDDTNMPGGQIVNFGDAVGLLRIEANTTLSSAFDVGGVTTTVLQGYFARITGFKPGDAIKLVGIDPTGLSYSFGSDPNYGSNLLTLSSGGTEVARLRFPTANLVDGAGTFDGANTGDFVLANDGSGDTVITVTGSVALWNGVTSGATTDWSAVNWTSGDGIGGLPGQYQAAEISLTPAEASAAAAGSFTTYVVTVTTAETAGSVTFDDPLAGMLISAPLTLAAVPGQSSGGEFIVSAGNGIGIAAGGTVTTTRFYSGAQGGLSLETGGLLNIAGVAPLTLGSGLAGFDVEGGGQSTGGTIDSTGNFIVGQNANAQFTAENNVVSSTATSQVFGSVGSDITASYTQVGGNPVNSDAQQQGPSNLMISGPNTTWSDIGGDASTPFSGAMLVGGGEPNLNNLGQIGIGSGGAGRVEVSDGATLTDRSYALIALAKGSTGTVEVDNGGTWIVGVGTVATPGSIVLGNSVVGTATLYSSNLPHLDVGSGGNGTLAVNSGTVEVGGAAAFNTLSMVVGTGNNSNDTASGVVVVQGTGALLTAGPMEVGHRSNGFLDISNGGTVMVASNPATAEINYGLIIGNLSGTVGAISGQVSINSGGVLIDHGDLVDGRNSAGVFSINSGSAQVSGGLYLGGFLSLNNGTHSISPTLVQGSASGTLQVSGGEVTVSSNTADMWQGSQINLNGGGVLAIGNTGETAPLPGELTVAAGAKLQGAGIVSVVSTPSTLRNFGTVLAGGLTTNGSTPSQINATLELNAVLAGPGVFEVAPGATLQLDNGVVNTSSFSFGTQNFGTSTGLNEFIRVQSPGAFQGTVGDFFGTGNRIDFIGASVVPGDQPSYTPNADAATGGTVRVATGRGMLTFQVTGFHPNGFSDGTDPGTTGTVVFANDAAPCFAAGTRVLTVAGEVAVEALRIGDRLPTIAGAVRSVAWIGWTGIDLDRHPHPERVAPVRVQAHAFGPGMPHRELRLSPDHAVALDGALIPIYLLVNGASIAREPARGTVRYFHVELDAHAVLLAEGLPAESYLDTGNRGQFANGHALRCLNEALA